MIAPVSLLISTFLISTVGDVDVEIHWMFRRTGSSVLIPGVEAGGVKFDNDMFHELKKVDGTPKWLAQYHGGPKVHDAYVRRGQFFPENKSFLLHGLTKEDSGIYEQQVNYATQLRVILSVIDPVEKSELTRLKDNNGSCQIILQCSGLGGDPLNATFLNNGMEINGNVSRSSGVSVLVLDGADPQTWGNYTCNLTNPVSWKISQHVMVRPEGIPQEYVSISISCIGLIIWFVPVICAVVQRIKCTNGAAGPNAETCVQVMSIVTRFIGLVTFCRYALEAAALAILLLYGVYFQEQRTGLILMEITYALIVLARIGPFCVQRQCGDPPKMLLAVVESVLLSADMGFIPLIFITEIVLYCQESDLCGIKMLRRWSVFCYLPMAMPVLVAVILGKNYFCEIPNNATPSQELQKGSSSQSPENDENNSGSNKGQAESNNTVSEETDHLIVHPETLMCNDGGTGGVSECEDSLDNKGGTGGVTECEDFVGNEGGAGGVPECEDSVDNEGETGGVTECEDSVDNEGGAGGVTECEDSVDNKGGAEGVPECEDSVDNEGGAEGVPECEDSVDNEGGAGGVTECEDSVDNEGGAGGVTECEDFVDNEGGQEESLSVRTLDNEKLLNV